MLLRGWLENGLVELRDEEFDELDHLGKMGEELERVEGVGELLEDLVALLVLGRFAQLDGHELRRRWRDGTSRTAPSRRSSTGGRVSVDQLVGHEVDLEGRIMGLNEGVIVD